MSFNYEMQGLFHNRTNHHGKYYDNACGKDCSLVIYYLDGDVTGDKYYYTLELHEDYENVQQFSVTVECCDVVQGGRSTHTLFVEVRKEDDELLTAGIVDPEAPWEYRDISVVYDIGPDYQIQSLFAPIIGGYANVEINDYDNDTLSRVRFNDGTWLGERPGFEHLNERSKRHAAAEQAAETRKENSKFEKKWRRKQTYLGGTGPDEEELRKIVPGIRISDQDRETRKKVQASRYQKMAARMVYGELDQASYELKKVSRSDGGSVDILKILQELTKKLQDMTPTITKMVTGEE